jgi:hypothetical protein
MASEEMKQEVKEEEVKAERGLEMKEEEASTSAPPDEAVVLERLREILQTANLEEVTGEAA